MTSTSKTLTMETRLEIVNLSHNKAMFINLTFKILGFEPWFSNGMSTTDGLFQLIEKLDAQPQFRDNFIKIYRGLDIKKLYPEYEYPLEFYRFLVNRYENYGGKVYDVDINKLKELPEDYFKGQHSIDHTDEKWELAQKIQFTVGEMSKMGSSLCVVNEYPKTKLTCFNPHCKTHGPKDTTHQK